MDENTLVLLEEEIEVQLHNEDDPSAYRAMRGIQTALIAVLLTSGWDKDPSGRWFKRDSHDA